MVFGSYTSKSFDGRIGFHADDTSFWGMALIGSSDALKDMIHRSGEWP